MTTNIIVALLGLVGTFIGSLSGILVANKLVNYRIEQLEKKVEKHNTIIERTYALEKEECIIEEQIKEMRKDIGTLQGFHSN